MAAYLGYTLWMKTLFCGLPAVVHDMRTRRRSEEGTGQARSPPLLLFAVPNVTAYPLMASVPITVLLHNGLLLCSFNLPIKGLKNFG